jgi:hypothetical protein
VAVAGKERGGRENIKVFIVIWVSALFFDHWDLFYLILESFSSAIVSTNFNKQGLRERHRLLFREGSLSYSTLDL